MGRSVGEEPVDDQANDREDEYEKTPEELVAGGTVRLENLNCQAVSHAGQAKPESDDGATYSRR